MEKNKEKTNEKEIKKAKASKSTAECNDRDCPLHGSLKARGRTFKGIITRKLPKRIAIELDRVIYVPKYERYMKKTTRIHARLPECMQDIKEGDYVEVRECRPLSKIIHAVVIKRLKTKQELSENK